MRATSWLWTSMQQGLILIETEHVSKVLCFGGLQVFVSPWGWGEWSHKDFEAIMAGCLLVKPGADSYIMYPNLHQAGVTIINVKPDFSDMGTQVLALLQDLPSAQKIADAGMEALRQGAAPARFAEDLSVLLNEVLIASQDVNI